MFTVVKFDYRPAVIRVIINGVCTVFILPRRPEMPTLDARTFRTVQTWFPATSVSCVRWRSRGEAGSSNSMSRWQNSVQLSSRSGIGS